MGLLAVPLSAEAFSIGAFREPGKELIPNGASQQEIGIPLQPGIDREWELLAATIPSFAVQVNLTSEFVKNPPVFAEYAAAWSQEIQVAVAFEVRLSGLVVGSVGENFTLAPTAIHPPGVNLFLAQYELPRTAITTSLQNPITIQGPEKLAGHLRVTFAFPELKRFVWEHEEGTGESKHTVKTEVIPGEQDWTSNWTFAPGPIEAGNPQNGAIVLYVNERDKEPYVPPSANDEPPLRPASIPM